MAVSGHLLVLILLVPVLSLSTATETEYYVRPTDPTYTSCPAQPCLTLSQYINDQDHYFKSNTVFKFLPGTHHMDTPVTIGNVHNMSFEGLSDDSGMYPYVVAELSCETEIHECIHLHWEYNTYLEPVVVCCAAVWFHGVNNVTVKGINIAVQTPNEPISAVVFKNVSEIKVHLSAMCSSTVHTSFGFIIYGATSVEVHSSTVVQCSVGLLVCNTTNTHITKLTAVYNTLVGIVLDMTTHSRIISTFAARNARDGIFLSTMKNTYITNVTAIYNGGNGMALQVMSNTYISNATTAHNDENGMSLISMTNTFITDTIATHNGEVGMLLSLNMNTSITKVTVTHNGKRLTGVYIGLTALLDGQISIETSASIHIYNTSFATIFSKILFISENPILPPAVISLLSSSLQVSECNFTGNQISAVKAKASDITVSGNVVFSNNRAFAGTAFVLVWGSFLVSAENSHIYFLNNHATNIGGVFYIPTKLYGGGSGSSCFLFVEGSRFHTRFTFSNNSAGKGGDILYGGQVAFTVDRDWNCLDALKNISNISQNGLSLVSSDALRVCLCNGRGQPDCLVVVDPTLRTVYPGQTINISAVVVGQNFGTVSGSAHAQFLQSKILLQLGLGQEVQSVTQHKCNNLYYTIFSQSEVSEAALVLTEQEFFVSDIANNEVLNVILDLKKHAYSAHQAELLVYSNNPVYVNLSLLPCPLGFMLTTHSPFKCDCNSLLQQFHGIQCHIQEQTFGRSGLLWVGMIQDDNEINGTVAVSQYCSLDYCNSEYSNVTFSAPDSQCNYNHSGTLCGGCQPGLSLALGSAQCLACSNKYLSLLIPLTLMGPLLVFSIKLLDITISQGTLNGLIFYVNIIKANEYIFLPQKQTNPLTVFIAWLNLDLGIETCLFQGLTAYSKTWLQFVFPFYIWSIAGLIIILAKYSDRVAKVMGNNSVPVLATLFLLSYAKLIRTIITTLSYTMVYTSHGIKAVWTADGNVDYLGPKHAPLFATAIAVLLFLWLPYTLLLFLGQWLHRCNCRLIVKMLMKIKPFLDAHYGPLKSKHRYWFGTLLLVRGTILLISALVPANRSSIILLCILVSAIALAYFGQMVYNNLAVSMFDTSSFMNLAILTGANSFFITAGRSLAVSAYTLIGLTFVQFIGLIIFKVLFIVKQSEKVMGYLHKEQPGEDDQELCEEAANQRELESDAEEQDSEV